MAPLPNNIRWAFASTCTALNNHYPNGFVSGNTLLPATPEASRCLGNETLSGVRASLDSFTVSFIALPTGKGLPLGLYKGLSLALENGGNSQRSSEPTMHRTWGVPQKIFGPANHKARNATANGPLIRHVKVRVAHAPGMPGTFSLPPRVSDPDMHHGPCVTHVAWCMPGSLSCGFVWSQRRGKRSLLSRRMHNTQFHVSGKRPMWGHVSDNPTPTRLRLSTRLGWPWGVVSLHFSSSASVFCSCWRSLRIVDAEPSFNFSQSVPQIVHPGFCNLMDTELVSSPSAIIHLTLLPNPVGR